LSALLVAIGALLFIASGLVALVRGATRVAAAGQVIAAITGLTGCALAFRGAAQTLTLPWAIPGGAIAIRLDALSAFFAAPVFLLAGAGAIYAEAYWPPSQTRAGYVRCFFGLLAGALALLMTADNTILFLAAWEIVALASFFLV